MKYILKQRNLDSEESLARSQFQVGMEIYGYCCGYFGRDSYGIKTIMSIDGNHMTVRDGDRTFGSGEIGSWVALLKSSNDALRELEDSERF